MVADVIQLSDSDSASGVLSSLLLVGGASLLLAAAGVAVRRARQRPVGMARSGSAPSRTAATEEEAPRALPGSWARSMSAGRGGAGHAPRVAGALTEGLWCFLREQAGPSRAGRGGQEAVAELLRGVRSLPLHGGSSAVALHLLATAHQGLEAAAPLLAATAPEDLALGCVGACLRHQRRAPRLPRSQLRPVPAREVREAGWGVDAKWAGAVYAGERGAGTAVEALVEALAEEPGSIKVAAADILRFRPTSALARPAVAVALDRERQLILVVVRGSDCLQDWITNLGAAPEPWGGQGQGRVHRALRTAAQCILAEVGPLVLRLLAAHPGLGVRLVGHSLGGGVAGLLALAMHRDDRFAPHRGRITAVGFGSAAVMCGRLARRVRGFVTCVVRPGDVVPRLSLAAAVGFLQEAAALAGRVREAVQVTAAALSAGRPPEGLDVGRLLEVLARQAVQGLDPLALLGEALGQLIGDEYPAPAPPPPGPTGPEALYPADRLLVLAPPRPGARCGLHEA
ncbi:hypothetical protein HYH03_015340 [Edaphochlamys debaryana]|uniref:Fungal lipase-type domain-containing protein n=1 Tax=Edaphochlamys debaryana TaxID=47281 RepID=A0A835XLZ5_9CHLO|nr:hypothetical protein HYH03_015340 [Edaphochlamys debaryana]|eukprot:KAG2485895.1 hypothetical protein HYH03_015340 [Edaphochlamys debaryana]